MTGLHLAQYRIDAELGRGGMGIVYRATDTKLDRTVAIKVLPPAALSSDEDRARFYREAKAAAQLHHPHIATVFQVDEAEVDGSRRPFIAMEFVDGRSLAARIGEGPLKLEEAVRIARQVGSALEAAHEAGIVHRDIKSQNVMLTSKGEAKVLDFGLAKTAESTMLTRQGSTLGTVASMSPEQARGEDVDARTDIWALGVLLYEMVSGRHPFARDYEQAAVYSILNEDPEPLTALRTGVPMGLEFVVGKCIEKGRSARYASATDFLVDLDSIDGLSQRLSALSSGPRPALAPPERRSAPWYRKPAALGALAGALIVGALAGRFVLGPAPDPRPLTTLPLTLPGVDNIRDIQFSRDGRQAGMVTGLGTGTGAVYLWSLETGKVTTLDRDGFYFDPRFSPDGQEFLYTDYTEGTLSIRVSDGARMESFGRAYQGMRDDAGRLLHTSSLSTTGVNDGIHRLDPEAGDDTLIVPTNGALDHDGLFPVFAFEGFHAIIGSAAARFREDDLVWIDTDAGTYRVLVTQAEFAGFDRDGFLYYRQLQTGSEWSFAARRFDPERGAWLGPAIGLPDAIGGARRFRVLEDGTLFAFADISHGMELRWLDPDGSLRDVVPLDRGDDYTPRISPDGAYLLGRSDPASSPDGRGSIDIQGVADASVLTIAEGYAISDPAWSADGRSVFAHGQNRIVRIATDGSGRTDTLAIPRDYAREAAPSPDGIWLAYMSSGPFGAWNLYAFNLETGEDRVVAESDVYLHDPFWSPDGRYVAYERTVGADDNFGDGQIVRVREFGSAADWLISDDIPSARFWDPEWSSDGRYIYYRSPTNLYRRRVQLEPSFRPLGQPEMIASFSGEFLFTLSPVDGRILVRIPRVVAGDDAPRMYLALNWAQGWKSVGTDR